LEAFFIDDALRFVLLAGELRLFWGMRASYRMPRENAKWPSWTRR
jgi:hypothetical protein